MSNLEELIERLCPDGVEYKRLGDIGRISMCKRVLKSQTNSVSGVPFYKIGTFGKEADSYISEELFLDYKSRYPYPKKGDVLISASGTIGRTVIFDGKPSYFQDSNIIWVANNEEFLTNKFLYYIYQTNPWKVADGGTIQRLYNSDLEKIQLPVPPLEVQREIVRILDNFTFLTTELAAELAARQKQYEYYRDLLLTFKPNESTILNERTNELELSSAIRWMKLGDTCLHSCSGATPKKSNSEYYVGGTVPWIRTQNVTFNNIYSVDSFITEKAVQETVAKWIPENCVIVAISGASAGRCAINKIKATTNQHCLNMEIDSSKALYKYVFYCLCNQYEELLSKKQGARGDLNSSLILDTLIPVPPLEVQQRIVDILDRFDSLCNDISSGLPAEIEMRQKQYEYYRDKLLTFKELKKGA